MAKTQDTVRNSYDDGAKGFDEAIDKYDFPPAVYRDNHYANIGDVTGITVMDLACGQGRFSFHMAKTAKKVLGIDFSQGLVDIANKKGEEMELNNLSFICRDACDIGEQGEFDLVLAFHLCCYAPSAEILQKMLSTVFRSCRPGGRVVGITCNYPEPEAKSEKMRYFYKTETVGDHAPAEFGQIDEDGKEMYRIQAFSIHPSTLERYLTEAGFANIKSWDHKLGPEAEGYEVPLGVQTWFSAERPSA